MPGAWAQVRETPDGEPIGRRQLLRLAGEAMGGAELWLVAGGGSYYVRPGDVPELPKPAPARVSLWRRLALSARLWIARRVLRLVE